MRPSMTARKVHYWLDTGLLGQPLRKGRRGVPTLLSFEQVLKVRTLQQLRDELEFSLQKVRRGVEQLLVEITADNWHELKFFRTGAGEIGYVSRDGVPLALSAQGVFAGAIPKLEAFIAQVREEWTRRRIAIAGFEHLVSDAGVLAGSPIIQGTRIETAFVANLAVELTAREIHELFPYVEQDAITEAAEFEGVELLAA